VSEGERQKRLARLAALRAEGIDPYPARLGPRTAIAEVRRLHDGKDANTLDAEAHTAAVAGRVRAIRSFGKLAFLKLVENGVGIQVSIRREEVPADVFDFAQKIDVGDFLRVQGPVWRTQKGELTIALRSVDLLAKCLQPLPEKWHGLADVEARSRQRHLDLIANERAREVAVLRSRVVTTTRSVLEERGFLEVETPVLQPIYGGAAARPFTTHHNAFDQKLYLRISDELYLKRLVIGGLDRVYEIGRVFRNEGISRKHNPEFSMLECYQAYADYADMMDLARLLVEEIAASVLGGTRIGFQGHEIELSGDWPRISMRDAIRNATGVDILAADHHDALRAAIRAKGLDPGDAPTWSILVDDLFSEHVEPALIQPTFITDYPRDLSPLAKGSARDPRLVERFELFLAGFEIVNAFSELNDPEDQRRRFEDQRRAAAQGDAEAHPMDEDFLSAMEYGMPPTGGLGMGIDRLTMVLADAPNLREVILFPHLRTERQ
jgi:lysyl-tRNA synthetase, class II